MTHTWPPPTWNCPNCQKDHTKPHFAFRGQVDLNCELGATGRVKFNREGSGMDCGQNKADTPTKSGLPSTGPAVVKGMPQGLFCPHCGYIQDVIKIRLTANKIFKAIKGGVRGFFKIQTSMKCICGQKATYSKGDTGLCEEHYTAIYNV